MQNMMDININVELKHDKQERLSSHYYKCTYNFRNNLQLENSVFILGDQFSRFKLQIKFYYFY